ncbi:T9SS type A sorting domain-containing protein [Aestuariivivens insulae]|uniref:T9SS type A sorting domain-containing protein n=1 Tax=Aestuariivivens insulae TaxID=1621988 RepID=UPI001F56CDDF|nr:T9SS type A sorting domain-containing protein [Aestuariivivens insulae]
MKKLNFFALTLIVASLSWSQTNVGISGTVDDVYINEFHYDNDGGDVGEFIEIAGPAGTDLSSYTITLYNGGNSQSYKTIPLTGTIDNESMSGVGAIAVTPSVNFQNGSPDGLCLSKTGSSNVQFLSYEGTFTATDGPAATLPSVDIGVSEPTNTPVGYSLEYDETSMAWVTVSDDTPGDFTQGPTLSSKQHKIRGFSIYPNPTTLDFVTISSNSSSLMDIIIIDLLGKQVIKQTISNNKLNVSYLKKGIYLIKVSQEGAVATSKLIIR